MKTFNVPAQNNSVIKIQTLQAVSSLQTARYAPSPSPVIPVMVHINREGLKILLTFLKRNGNYICHMFNNGQSAFYPCSVYACPVQFSQQTVIRFSLQTASTPRSRQWRHQVPTGRNWGLLTLILLTWSIGWAPNTVIPRLTSDPTNEFFWLMKIFSAVFRTWLTNMDSANECFSGCAR